MSYTMMNRSEPLQTEDYPPALLHKDQEVGENSFTADFPHHDHGLPQSDPLGAVVGENGNGPPPNDQKNETDKILSPIEFAGKDASTTPIELQLEVVDMDDPKMDALEWAVRKVVPIPKKYYWETGNHDLPFRIKAWHQVVGTLGGTVRWLDGIGKPITEATGLTSSRFDYVTSNMTDKQWEIASKRAKERKARNSARRLAAEAEAAADYM